MAPFRLSITDTLMTVLALLICLKPICHALLISLMFSTLLFVLLLTSPFRVSTFLTLLSPYTNPLSLHQYITSLLMHIVFSSILLLIPGLVVTLCHSHSSYVFVAFVVRTMIFLRELARCLISFVGAYTRRGCLSRLCIEFRKSFASRPSPASI